MTTKSAFFYEVRDQSGEAIFGAPITIKNSDGSLATIYDQTGTAISNPIFSRGDGLALCYLIDGNSYNLIINSKVVNDYTHNGAGGGGGGATITAGNDQLVIGDGHGNGTGDANLAWNGTQLILDNQKQIAFVDNTENANVTIGVNDQDNWMFATTDDTGAAVTAFTIDAANPTPAIHTSIPLLIGPVGGGSTKSYIGLRDQDPRNTNNFNIYVSENAILIYSEETSKLVMSIAKNGNILPPDDGVQLLGYPTQRYSEGFFINLKVDGDLSVAHLAFPTPTMYSAVMNMPAGVAPTTPVDGDFWNDGTGFFMQVSGVSVGPFIGRIGFIEQLCNLFEVGSNKTYPICNYMQYAAGIASLSIHVASGTCTAALCINGTPITGLEAIAVTNTPQHVAASALNVMALGDVLTLVVTDSATPVDLSTCVQISRL